MRARAAIACGYGRPGVTHVSAREAYVAVRLGVTASAALAVPSALLYGVSDFSTGLSARSMRVVSATTVSYTLAAVVMLISLAVTGGQWSPAAILWGAAAGAFAIIGLLAFYAAMAAGPMSIASPLIAVLEAVVPVAVALVLGDHLVWWAWLAIVAAIVAGVLLAADRSAASVQISQKAVLLAIVSGSALGLSVVALNAAPKVGRLIPGVCETLIGLVVLAAFTVTSRARTKARATPRPPESRINGEPVRRQRGVLLAATGGLLLGGANALLIAALHTGSLAIVGVLVSLYPVPTIVLARLALNERLATLQITGATLALLAAAALALT